MQIIAEHDGAYAISHDDRGKVIARSTVTHETDRFSWFDGRVRSLRNWRDIVRRRIYLAHHRQWPEGVETLPATHRDSIY